MRELEALDALVESPINIGIRIASEEDPTFDFYTSRLGIRYSDIVPFYENMISKSKKFKLKMLHFFINTGMRDTAYYWNELAKCVGVYCDLKLICPELDSMNIGGGFPIKNSLASDFDYEYMAEEIISRSFCCFMSRIWKIVAPDSPTVKLPNSVKMLGSATPRALHMSLICEMISSAMYS